MKTTSCTSFILLISFALCCGAMSIDLNKVCEQYMDLDHQSKYIWLFFFWFPKETPSTGATADLNRKWVIELFTNWTLKYTKKNPNSCRIKRSTDDLDNLLNEIFTDEEFLNYLTIHGIDKEKVQSSPILQYLLLRKPSLFINRN